MKIFAVLLFIISLIWLTFTFLNSGWMFAAFGWIGVLGIALSIYLLIKAKKN